MAITIEIVYIPETTSTDERPPDRTAYLRSYDARIDLLTLTDDEEDARQFDTLAEASRCSTVIAQKRQEVTHIRINSDG